METPEVIRTSHNGPKTQPVSKWAFIDRGLPGQGNTAAWPCGTGMSPREDLRVGACYQTPEHSSGSVMLCHPADAISSYSPSLFEQAEQTNTLFWEVLSFFFCSLVCPKIVCTYLYHTCILQASQFFSANWDPLISWSLYQHTQILNFTTSPPNLPTFPPEEASHDVTKRSQQRDSGQPGPGD